MAITGPSLCGNVFGKLAAVMGSTFSRPQSKKIEATAKCPDCGKEFTVAIEVEQQVVGTILNSNIRAGGGLSGVCPWNHE